MEAGVAGQTGRRANQLATSASRGDTASATARLLPTADRTVRA
jgi:hypothetical protein